MNDVTDNTKFNQRGSPVFLLQEREEKALHFLIGIMQGRNAPLASARADWNHVNAQRMMSPQH